MKMDSDDKFLLWMIALITVGFPLSMFVGIALLHLVGIDVQ